MNDDTQNKLIPVNHHIISLCRFMNYHTVADAEAAYVSTNLTGHCNLGDYRRLCGTMVRASHMSLENYQLDFRLELKASFQTIADDRWRSLSIAVDPAIMSDGQQLHGNTFQRSSDRERFSAIEIADDRWDRKCFILAIVGDRWYRTNICDSRKLH